MPRYERGIGPGKMLWEIEVEGSRWLIRYGKARAKELESYTRSYATPELARIEAEKLIAERTKDGFRLISDEPLVREPSPVSDLEQQFRANPDDDGVYLVLSDWLQAQGHPRGRLMAIQDRLARASEAERATLAGMEIGLLRKHRVELLGPLAQWNELHLEARWHRGYLEDIHLSGHRDDDTLTGVSALGALCELPDAHFVRSVRIGIPNAHSEAVFDDMIEQVAANARHLPRLVRLFVGEFEYPAETEMSWAHLGRLDALFAAFPRLEQLIVQGGEFELGAIALPALRHLEVRTGGLAIENLRAITDGALPALETLIVWIGHPDFGSSVEIDDLDPVLDGRWPNLRHLGLCNAEFTDGICTVLNSAPISARLETLDLSLGTLTDAGTARLAFESFPRLRTIDVSGNYLTEVGLERLRGLCEVISTSQRDDDGQYYVSVGE